MWRRGFNTPINNDDNGLNCGHIQNHPHSRKINCGVCGDPKSLRRPRPNEHGGTYGLGVIGREYNQGSNIQVIVNITAAHRGRFTFAMCNLDQGQETEQCFEKYPLKLADGSNTYKLPLPDYPQSHYINLKLPRDLTCNHCVLRWQWIAGKFDFLLTMYRVKCRKRRKLIPEKHNPFKAFTQTACAVNNFCIVKDICN